MTPDEIKRYLALPEEFRDACMSFGGMDEDDWWYEDTQGPIQCDAKVAELLAIASMVVGLRKAGQEPTLLTDQISQQAMCYVLGAAPTREDSDFLALLAACEAVAKEATR